ncbi:hypothetical protein EYF80_015257 [Liparis tanakae]|uniref:Uncharacterized protein n=1 Tax=Liparis tanakae TaxID=230148 RepID=A0A4Z2I912_9TELE|nr:hypothetical protein EYF80_015257 [Liparis tanakae]
MWTGGIIFSTGWLAGAKPPPTGVGLQSDSSSTDLEKASLQNSGGGCPALCVRGGRGRTWVTWRSGEPLVGSVDRHSHDAEWLRGAECGGTEGVGGEGLGSSRPAATQNNTHSMTCNVM